MAYSASKIECLRFAGRHKAEGIGCCAIDILQGFVNDPDAPGEVKLLHGDDQSMLYKGDKPAKLGPTNLDIFLGYLRIGTFGTEETPNRIFLAAITQQQINTPVGKKWLSILKEQGFEFVRGCDNSVYSGEDVPEDGEDFRTTGVHPVYLFGLFRNIGKTRLADPFAPPEFWNTLPEPTLKDEALWHGTKTTFYTPTETDVPTTAKASPFLTI